MNMANGMVKGIVKNAVIAVGGSADTFDHLTANPFTPPATWTGAAKVDMSKEGWKDRIQEYATAEFLEANGMDADLAKTVASTTNAKIKAKKAKKEEKTKAIESTAQTALAVTAMVLTAGAAVGAVLTGTASLGSYVQVASIALQAGIGSRTGGVEGAMAGAANGILQAFAGSLGTKEAGALKDKADEIGQQVNAGLMNMDEGVAALEAAKNAAKLANVGAKTLAATNVSYTKEDGWGIKANVTGLLSAVGVTQGGYGGSLLQRLTNVTIGQSQRGGASLNLGLNTPIGNMGINYTGATGTFGGSYDIMERQVGGLNLSSELSYDGEQGLSVSGNADFGNGLGLGAENGRNGATGSLTLLGSTQGTVNEDGVYEANGNFLGEISGQDIIDLHNTRAQQEGNSILEDAARNAPAKSAKDAANSDNSVDDRDNDAQEETGGQGSEGLVDLVFAGTAVLFSAGAAFIAGGGSSAASPSVPTSGQGAAGNGGNATVARKPEDDEPPKKQPTKEELDNFKDNVFLNTTRAVTDDYLNKLDAQGVDTKEMRAHAEAQRAAGVRDLTPAEIQAKRLNKELNDLKSELDKASTIAHDNGTLSDATNSPMSEILKYRDEVNKKIAEKEKEIKQAIDANNKQQAANLNQSFQTGIGNIAKSHEAMNEATNIARKDTSQAGNLNQSFQTNSSNIELGRNALNEGTKTSEADKIKQAKDLDQAWKTKKESMDSTINVRGVREAYSAANLTERSYIGEKWDSVFNNNGIKDTGTGIYTGRVLREGGYLGGLFGATVYHERLDNFVAVDHGQPSLVHIDEVKGDNNLPFNHERILRNTPQGPIKEDLIWSGSTRSNNGQGSYNQNDANQPNVAYHRVVRGTGENQTQSIVGENGLFTSGFISPTNDNINFYNQSSTTLLGNKYQVTNIRQDNGLMREGWDMGGYEASRRPDKQNVRENYFALTDGPDFPDLPPRNSNGVFSPTAADNGVFISQGDPSHGPLKSADFPNNPFHTIPDPNGEFNDAQKAHRDNGHYATDLTPRNGENGPIIPDLYASKDGKVVGINPSSDNTLIIRYDDGTEVAYKHESGIARNIFPGQRVVAGQYVGRIGNIGNSKGAHLHLEVTNPRLSTSEMKNQYYGGSY
jgi:murein DD-endopeptidase MepM/ murein hydrolase activator NlpD